MTTWDPRPLTENVKNNFENIANNLFNAVLGPSHPFKQHPDQESRLRKFRLALYIGFGAPLGMPHAAE